MPLDIGAGADSIMVAKGVQTALEPLLSAGASIGQALRTLREARNLSLTDIAEVTCVRRAYLQAVEDMRMDQLPSRPFAIGYVRAYAQALGASPDLAVSRFKDAFPSPEEALKAPLGVPKERDPRLSWLAGFFAVVVTAVVIWNVAQHAVAHDGPPSPPVPASAATPAAPLGARGPVALGAALPPPADSDVPTPYVTPGMAKAVGGVEAQAAAPAPPKPRYNPRAAIYGAPADKAALTLQALKAASLVIRGADGSIYFARQLAAGESFRAPANVPGLTVDVSDPLAFNVIVRGEDKGPLQTAQTPVGKLVG